MSSDPNPEDQALISITPRPVSEEAERFGTASLLWVACITLLLVPMATLLDMPIARWFAADPLPDIVGDVLDYSLIYAHGSGIALMLVGVLLLAPRCRWHVPRLAALAEQQRRQAAETDQADEGKGTDPQKRQDRQDADPRRPTRRHGEPRPFLLRHHRFSPTPSEDHRPSTVSRTSNIL